MEQERHRLTLRILCVSSSVGTAKKGQMDKNTNLRNMTITTESGKDVTNTQQLSGQAHETPAQKDTNETKQYTTGALKKGTLGGENTNS
jgi:hypothetical protein